jgi:hypothetical protein
MKLRKRTVAIAIAIASSTGLLIASHWGDAGSHVGYVPRIDLASFTTDVENPLLPLRPGVFDEGPTVKSAKRIVAEVTGDGRTVMGVPCAVVRDTATVAGKVVEVTPDWCLRPLVETFNGDLEHGPHARGIEPGP